jgi:hypothetical protein
MNLTRRDVLVLLLALEDRKQVLKQRGGKGYWSLRAECNALARKINRMVHAGEIELDE